MKKLKDYSKEQLLQMLAGIVLQQRQGTYYLQKSRMEEAEHEKVTVVESDNLVAFGYELKP